MQMSEIIRDGIYRSLYGDPDRHVIAVSRRYSPQCNNFVSYWVEATGESTIFTCKLSEMAGWANERIN